MRIHLSLDPKHLVQPVAGPSSGPLVNIGGDLVLVELQGELYHEGDKADGVVGILGLDRPDKPTLHLGEHHLLHGKMATLSKPYAVIRRALALVPAEGAAGEVEGDAEEEDDLEDDLLAMDKQTHNRPSAKNSGKGKEKGKADEEEEEGPLFPDMTPPQTPKRGNGHPSSSPSSIYPSSAMKDYSSELDFSSPPVSDTSKRDREEESDSEDEEEEEEERKRKKAKKSGKKGRTRRYEVVGIVRKKVVFALRPEPIVTATILPE